MTQRFEIPGRLPALNEWTAACKSHYARAGRMKREAQDAIVWAIKAARIKPLKGKAYVHFTWIEPNMRRDFDNIDFGKKFIFDAMQEAGVIPNDNWKHIAGYDNTFRLNKANPRIVVEIEEV